MAKKGKKLPEMAEITPVCKNRYKFFFIILCLNIVEYHCHLYAFAGQLMKTHEPIRIEHLTFLLRNFKNW